MVVRGYVRGIVMSSPTNSIQTVTSLHLEAEVSRLTDLAQRIRDSGPVAPVNCWIEDYTVTRQTGPYHYKRVNSDRPQFGARGQARTLHLGKAGSPDHQDWQQRLKRRDALTEIDYRVGLIRQLMARQQSHPLWMPDPLP